MLSLLIFAAGLFSASGFAASAGPPGEGPALSTPAPADTVEAAREVRVRLKFMPAALWSSSAGFGIGAGVQVDNLLFPGAALLVTAAPAQHRGVYTATYVTANPATARLYGLLGTYYQTTGHYWFFGLGPATLENNRITVERAWLEAEARVGLRLFEGKLLLQPNVRLLRSTFQGFEDRDPGAFDRLPEASRAHLRFLSDTSELEAGYAYGLGAALELLDAPLLPRRGLLLQGTVQRLGGQYSSPPGAAAGTETDLQFDTFTASAYGFIPLSERGHTLSLRVLSAFTDNRGAAPIPFYLLPTLDQKLLPGYSRYRFVGEDLLLLGAAYEAPLFVLMNFVGLEGIVAVQAGSVYDDLFAQFTPRITLERDLAPDRETYPLRPSLAVGARLFSAAKRRSILSIMAGLSPEGLGLVTFRFVHNLSRFRPHPFIW